jgi:hypothetical protein
MQPLGRKKSRFPGKVDCHPGKKLENWWENAFSRTNKKSDRREGKRHILRSLINLFKE